MTTWWVYVHDSHRNLCTGITTDLQEALREHRGSLLYSEKYDDELSATRRERQIRGWSRKKKVKLIRRGTP
jgi:predicted GIY-YIG superfamily endonuclease